MRNPGRSIGILALLLILAAPGFSQPYGNEWINFNQQYFKIKTAKDGIYRLTYDALAAAGFPTGSVDPRNLQLFHRGTEQSIIVSGELDARFDPGDYIEFFGTKNDGTLDQWLYRTPEAQPDPYYNLYSDTTACFLTWNLNNIHGKRISSFSENNTSGLPVESYYLVEKLVQFSSDYSPGLTYPLGNPQGQTHASIYDFGEGWTGTTIGKGSSTDFILDSLGPMYTSGPDPELNILINGRNNYPHIVEIFAGPGTATLRSLAVITFSYDSSFLFRGSLAWSDFDLSGKLTLRVKDNGANATDPDFISVSYLKLRYAHTPTVSLIDGGKIALKPNTTGKSYISFDVSGNPGRLWDITEADDPVNIGYNVTSSGINAIVPGTSSGANLILWGTNDPEPSIEKVYFRSFDPTQPNYLVISHKSLMKPSGIYSDPVRALAAYRASSQGGGFDTLVTDVGQLYNQFSYGEISPLAIKNFCSYFLDKGNPLYLLLAGKSIYAYFKYYRMPAGSLPFSDLVPTYGYPGSDALYTAGKKGTTYEESILTGRIPAKSPEEVAAYLNKLKESEAFPHNALWKKDLIHLSGGATVQELSTFKNYVNDFKSVAEDKYLGGQVLTLSRQTNNSIETINLSG